MLDAKKQAHGLSVLLAQLLERGELRLSPSSCVILIGFGAGANAMLHFAGTLLLGNSFTALRDSTRLLAVVNPFPVSPNSTFEVQQVKNQLQALKRTLERGSHQEQLQAVIAAMFSAEFIEKVGEVRCGDGFAFGLGLRASRVQTHFEGNHIGRMMSPTPANCSLPRRVAHRWRRPPTPSARSTVGVAGLVGQFGPLFSLFFRRT